jgi:hypothetical protein
MNYERGRFHGCVIENAFPYVEQQNDWISS